MTKRWWILPLLLGGLLAGCMRMAERADPNVGKPAPEIEGTDADGRPFRLADYRGKVVLLDFWRTG